MASFSLLTTLHSILLTSVLHTALCDIRINCMPDVSIEAATQRACVQRRAAGCIWAPSEDKRTPKCIFDAKDPRTFPGYDVNSVSWTPTGSVLTANLHRRQQPQSLFGGDFNDVHLAVTQIDRASLKLSFSWPTSDGEHANKNVADNECLDYDITEDGAFTMASGDLTIELQSRPCFGFKISRTSESNMYGEASKHPALFDTTLLPALIFSEHFVQISGMLGSKNNSIDLYGLGQQFHPTFNRRFDYRRVSMLNLDQYPVPDMNLYGAQPFYVATDPANTSQLHGVFLQTDFPMDVFLQDSPQTVTYRVAGQSGSISLYFFGGPSYDDVIEQYLHVIGKPYMPPFWSLGFHLSRYGYNNTAHLKQVWDRNRAAQIPQDVQTVDIDTMNKREDFTVGQSFRDLPEFVKNTIHGTGRKLVPITDPAIESDPKLAHSYRPLKVGLEMDVFVKDARTGAPLQTKVWPGPCYMPDFTHPNCTPYWLAMMSEFHQNLPFDGIWLDMNEPATFVDGSATGCSKNALNNPPFSPVTYSPIYKKTICMDARHYGDKTHMERHNRYGHFEAKVTRQALSKMQPDRRPFVYTRANAPGTGVFAGNWMGDTVSDWVSLAQSIIGLLEMNMFGIPMTGSDICGFNQDTTEELCMRWHQLGAFYPFCRNHNSEENIAQDPAVWSNATVMAIRRSLRLRYTLLPYLYSLLSRAHIKGTPVIRPIIALDGVDARARSISDQFMWGDALMITPILQEKSVKRQVYFPPGIWYPMMKNALIDGQPNVHAVISNSSSGGVNKEVQTHWQDVGYFLRGGQTIFRQGYAETTKDSFQTPFTLEVGLTSEGTSHGQLYWDDGVDPRAPYNGKYCLVDARVWGQSSAGGTVQVISLHDGCPSLPPVSLIRLHGLGPKIKIGSIRVSGVESNSVLRYGYDAVKLCHYVQLQGMQIDIGFTVTWKADVDDMLHVNI